MAKNDLFYKILFAIQIALLPMVIFAYLLLPQWAMSIFLAALVLVKVWLELFKDKISFSHAIIDSVGSILTFTTLLVLFINAKFINTALGIASIVLIIVYNLLRLALFKHNMPEFVDAVDYCYILFECLALAAFIFLSFNKEGLVTMTNIGLFAIIITTAVSIGYKLYYSLRYTNLNVNFWRKK